MHRKPFETDIADDGAHLSGPWRSPRQMLTEQVYDDHVSIHDDATAKRLGFRGGAIEGPNSLQPICAARRAALGRGVVRDGLLVGALSQPRLRGRRRAGGHGQAARRRPRDGNPDGQARRRAALGFDAAASASRSGAFGPAADRSAALERVTIGRTTLEIQLAEGMAADGIVTALRACGVLRGLVAAPG